MLVIKKSHALSLSFSICLQIIPFPFRVYSSGLFPCEKPLFGLCTSWRALIPGHLIAKNFCGSILADCFVLTPHNNQLRHCQRNTHSSRSLPSVHPSVRLLTLSRNLAGFSRTVWPLQSGTADVCISLSWVFGVGMLRQSLEDLRNGGCGEEKGLSIILNGCIFILHKKFKRVGSLCSLLVNQSLFLNRYFISLQPFFCSITWSLHNLGKHKHPRTKNRSVMTHDFATKPWSGLVLTYLCSLEWTRCVLMYLRNNK